MPTPARAAAVLLILCAGCGGGSEPSTSPVNAGQETPATSAETQAPSVTSGKPLVALTTEKLEAFERGLKKEIEAVRSAHELSRNAKTAEERGKAIEASFEHVTIPQGASAAGMPVRDYGDLREVVNGIFQTLDFQGKIDGPLSIDLSRVDAATKERLSRDPLAELPPQSADALRAHMGRLVPVWIEYMTLTAVAG
jgi:hypothetical protein